MKKLFLAVTILSASSTTAFAADNGFYLGGQAGWANVGDTIQSSGSNDNNVFDGGVFAGYQFNPFIAAQLGYTKLSNATSSESNSYLDPITGSTIYENANATLKTQFADLVVKGIYPIGCSGFDIYAKGGAAYVDEKADVNLSSTGDAVFQSFNVSGSGSTHAVRPEVGGGVSYDITPNLAADVDYTYIDGNSNFDHINAVTAGLAYHFN